MSWQASSESIAYNLILFQNSSLVVQSDRSYMDFGEIDIYGHFNFPSV